jgi:membrane-bound serine protease (ClpP class)
LVVVTFLVSMVVRAHRTQVATGVEGLLHKHGVARTRVGDRGKVFVHGEIWEAAADEEIPAGSPIEVVSVDGLKLRVRAEARQELQSNGERT